MRLLKMSSVSNGVMNPDMQGSYWNGVKVNEHISKQQHGVYNSCWLIFVI